MNTSIARMTLAVMCFIALGAGGAGCSSVERTRSEELDATAPWCGPTEQARVFTLTKTDFIVGVPVPTIEWRCGVAVQNDDKAMSLGCRYLTELGLNCNPYEQVRRARFYDRFAEDVAMEPPEKQFPYSHTIRVVCIDPLVFVAVPVPARGRWEGNTRLPYHSAVTWFSPTLRQPPAEIAPGSGDHREIPLPWGSLHVEREGDEWVVRASPAGGRSKNGRGAGPAPAQPRGAILSVAHHSTDPKADPHEMTIHLYVERGNPTFKWPDDPRIPADVQDDLQSFRRVVQSLPIRSDLTVYVAPRGDSVLVLGFTASAGTIFDTPREAWLWRDWRKAREVRNIGKTYGKTEFVGPAWFWMGPSAGESQLISVHDSTRRLRIVPETLPHLWIDESDRWSAVAPAGEILIGRIDDRELVRETSLRCNDAVDSLAVIHQGKILAAGVRSSGPDPQVVLMDRKGHQLASIANAGYVQRCGDEAITVSGAYGFARVSIDGKPDLKRRSWPPDTNTAPSPSGKYVQGFVPGWLLPQAVTYKTWRTPLAKEDEPLPPLMGGPVWLAW